MTLTAKIIKAVIPVTKRMMTVQGELVEMKMKLTNMLPNLPGPKHILDPREVVLDEPTLGNAWKNMRIGTSIVLIIFISIFIHPLKASII